MKKTSKFLLSSVVISVSGLISLQAMAFDQFVTVKFKNPVTKKFLQEMNQMTNTSVSQSLPSNTFKLKIGGVANNTTLDMYSEMFYMMKNVESVSPLPKDKVADKINPFYYMDMSTNQSQTQTPNTNTGDTQNNQNTTVIPDELIVKFNKDASTDDITSINNNLGGTSTYMKDSDSYKIKLPEYVDSDYAMNFYQNNRYVESVQQNTVTVPGVTASGSPNNSITTNSNQSGVALAIPLNGTDVKVTFKIGEEDKGVKWFNDVFGAEIVSKKGFHTYILRFPKNVNPKYAARAVKSLPIVSSSEVSYE